METLRPSANPPGPARGVSFMGRTFDVTAFPHIGPTDAEHVMVEYFDYQCPACHTMAGFMDALMARHPRDLAVILLPVPLDGRCNRHAPPDGRHPGSCRIAEIALALWFAKPEAFPSFHHALMRDPSPDSAEHIARETLTGERLGSALSDKRIARFIESDVADWLALSRQTTKLPKLLVRENRILHGLPSGEEDFIRVMEQELGL